MKMAVRRDGRLRRHFTQKDVAAALDVSVQTVRALIERGELTGVHVAGHSLRIAEEELERFMQSRRVGRPFTPDTHPQREEQTL